MVSSTVRWKARLTSYRYGLRIILFDQLTEPSFLEHLRPRPRTARAATGMPAASASSSATGVPSSREVSATTSIAG